MFSSSYLYFPSVSFSALPSFPSCFLFSPFLLPVLLFPSLHFLLYFNFFSHPNCFSSKSSFYLISFTSLAFVLPILLLLLCFPILFLRSLHSSYFLLISASFSALSLSFLEILLSLLQFCLSNPVPNLSHHTFFSVWCRFIFSFFLPLPFGPFHLYFSSSPSFSSSSFDQNLLPFLRLLFLSILFLFPLLSLIHSLPPPMSYSHSLIFIFNSPFCFIWFSFLTTYPSLFPLLAGSLFPSLCFPFSLTFLYFFSFPFFPPIFLRY